MPGGRVPLVRFRSRPSADTNRHTSASDTNHCAGNTSSEERVFVSRACYTSSMKPALVCLLLAGCATPHVEQQRSPASAAPRSTMRIHFIDVGQGAATLF